MSIYRGIQSLGCLFLHFTDINPVTPYSKNISTGVRFDPYGHLRVNHIKGLVNLLGMNVNRA